MTQVLIFTGSAGPGIAIAAAATALRAAAAGRRTLLLSLGAAHSLGALLGTTVGSAPATIAPGLDVLAIDGPADLGAAWEQGRGQMPAQLARIAGDELPLPPGIEMLFGLLRLDELAARYELVAIDAGPHDQLLRALALPDALRWAVRLLFGLDRGPGRSHASVVGALLPTSFMPAAALGHVQELRVQAERLRALLIAPGRSAAHYVLRPDRTAIEEARLAIPAAQLHGLGIASIIAGPLLPDELAATSFGAQQAALLGEARAIWPARELFLFALPDAEHGLASIQAIGAQLDVDGVVGVAAAPIAEEWNGAPAVAIELPGLPKNALQLTLSGDELIVRVGPYRRHILLPEGLRGSSNIRATREGERLIVRRRA